MDESDDFGDLDDSAFIEVATQIEQTTGTTFQPSPRPQKRRRVVSQDERRQSIPSRKVTQNRRQKSVIESDDDEEDEYAPIDTSNRRRSTSTGQDAASPPHGKKRKPRSRGKENGDTAENEDSPWTKPTKKRDRIHTPTTNVDLTDVYATQLPQDYSPPWKTRGAIWQKSAVSIGVHRASEPPVSQWASIGAKKSPALPDRSVAAPRPAARASVSAAPGAQAASGQSTGRPHVNGAAEEYDLAQELEDLPSDAFASSSSSPQKQDNDVVLLSAGMAPERRQRLVAPQTGLRQTTLFGRDGVNGDVPQSQVNKRYNFIVDQKEEPPTHHKLDVEAAKTWVYPTNLGTIRDYQFNIVARGLFHNLLVALPTGLGKTFIAATIMLNWFRWAPESQIVFVAPTKPLVSQQVEACFNIAGIPRSQTSLLTGTVTPAVRAEEWAQKRVFFMTPQTLLNDLKRGIANPKKIVLLVVDEAHRATGSYAYVEVVTLMRQFNPSFRVLALTATPGADVESVQKVIDGLDISKIEIRTENSLDIRGYVHQRTVEKHVFNNSEEMQMCMELYSEALQPCVNKVKGMNAYWTSDPLSLTPYGCTQARQRWFSEAGRNAAFPMKNMVNTIFTLLASISQGMELLKYHGIRPFYTKMKAFKEENEGSKSKYKKEILESDAFKKLMVRLHTWVSLDDFVGHPKLDFLQEAILNHFVNASEGRNADAAQLSETRIMVFAHFRDSAEEIVKVLKKHEPMIRPRVFVGQATAKNSEGMGQKEQLEVIEKFKKGDFNTLVATSIGEEGLDIGEVDLIICYDSKASPIRMLQRMGRTGRKREGKIIMLQMTGKEENDSIKAKDAYEKMQELIANGSSFNFHDDVSRRILPRDIQPTVDKRVVEIPLENSQSDFLPEPKRRGGRAPKLPPKKFHMPDGVITGFVTAGRMGEEIAPKSRGKKKAAPILPSEEPAVLPPLESVLLSDVEMKDLERRYQTVFDDDDAPMIDELDLAKHPTRQRMLSKSVQYARPGRVTTAFVGTLQRMHKMDAERINEFRGNVHQSDIKTWPDNFVESDTPDAGMAPAVIDVDMWEDDDPASQPQPATKAKAIPTTKAKPPPMPKSKALPKSKAPPKAKTAPQPTTPARRGRPPKTKSAEITPATVSTTTPRTKTPRFRVSDMVAEGIESSPPPTDPRMRLASQAVSLGSDDTDGFDMIDDTQAYRMDSDLVSFIADDNDVEEMPASSLPSLDFNGLGKGTQAVMKGARPKRPKKMEKIFTSDPTDDDAVVSSDSDDDIPIPTTKAAGLRKKEECIADSEEEDEDEEEDFEPVRPAKRARRVVLEDDEDE